MVKRLCISPQSSEDGPELTQGLTSFLNLVLRGAAHTDKDKSFQLEAHVVDIIP